LLSQFGVGAVYHYAPLHYLAFIARHGALLSKLELQSRGFAAEHFRSTSRKQDEQRGFAAYVHLTLDAHPPILQAKLNGGFPHFEVALPVAQLEKLEHILCRFNIAKTRYFLGAKQEPEESLKNGRYHGNMRLPVAISSAERRALLERNYGLGMIEVLILNQVPLGSNTVFRFFHDEDLASAVQVLEQLGVTAYAVERDKKISYKPSTQYRNAVREVLAKAVADSSWKGNGLEFDRIQPCQK
jgi:hypothetical protein